MLRETRDRLPLPPVATSFVLPLAVSVLRMNVPPRFLISAAFLRQLYGVEMGLATLASVLITWRPRPRSHWTRVPFRSSRYRAAERSQNAQRGADG